MELDQFMKELAVDFLTEIVDVFFPDLAQRLDFLQKKNLNKQFYTDSPQGAEREVDVLLEVKVKHPPPEFLLIHFESQQQKRFDFSARMLAYHCMIYAREIEGERQDSFSLAQFEAWQNRKRILSFVFCNYPLENGITQEGYQTSFSQTRLGCQYTIISLPMLSAREYLQKDNSVVCALAVFMNPADFSPAELKARCYDKLRNYLPHLTQKQYDDIVYALETYIELNEKEKQIFQRLIDEVYPEVKEMITNPLIEQGRQKGVQQSILRILSHRFTEFPSEIRSQILAINDAGKLEQILDAALETNSLEELTKNGLLEQSRNKAEIRRN